MNVLTIRRYIVGDMRNEQEISPRTGAFPTDEQRTGSSRKPAMPKQPTPPALSFKGLVNQKTLFV